MIPLISWLSLWGKCRKCRKPIGFLEPMIEIGVAAFFVLSYAFWPYPLDNSLEIARLVLWMMAGVGLAIMFAYDTKWSLLPDRVNFTVIGIGACSALLVVLGAHDKLGALLGVVGSALILSGLYWVLYNVSKGRWIGFGDIKLGLGLAFLLADWKLAFIALFTANLTGCLIVLPAMVAGKLKRNSHIPFGPLLIVGFIIAGLFGSHLVNIYFSSLF
jgi:prepilin signal peptidase PulO-like enzyme (type II secretory pathway)